MIKKYLPNLLTKYGKKYGNISLSEKQWIQTIENDLQRSLEHNHSIGKYKVDGYDKQTNTVYEFYGCVYHGCPKCYKTTDLTPFSGRTMDSLYSKQFSKNSSYKNLDIMLSPYGIVILILT